MDFLAKSSQGLRKISFTLLNFLGDSPENLNKFMENTFGEFLVKLRKINPGVVPTRFPR